MLFGTSYLDTEVENLMYKVYLALYEIFVTDGCTEINSG